jgi:hypothetical protein
MVLHPTSYDGSFVKYDGTVLDTFSGTCNSATVTHSFGNSCPSSDRHSNTDANSDSVVHSYP